MSRDIRFLIGRGQSDAEIAILAQVEEDGGALVDRSMDTRFEFNTTHGACGEPA